MRARYIAMIVILVVGYGLLELMQWQAGLGKYARSPQRVEIRKTGTAIVAGGRAGVEFRGADFRRRATLVVRCKDAEAEFRLKEGAVTREVCGVETEILAVTPERLSIEARWGDGLTRPVDAAAPYAAAGDETEEAS